MKKSFTLMEVIISVVLLSIITTFLYQTLSMTKETSKFYKGQLDTLKQQNHIKFLMFEDIVNKENNSTSTLTLDKNDNTIFTFQSSNTFHNPFSTYITYFVSRENNLIRCESNKKFNKNTIYNFVEDKLTYIDIVDKNVSKFQITPTKKDKNNLVVYIQYGDNKEIFFTLKPLR
jgi:Tfp pilus assembly protein PilE